ncbi:MAG: DNA-protecting protein DprA [Planctomycetes bacterium]|nr:DNA-protecting protein DprA [Planctomycetota bacterium]
MVVQDTPLHLSPASPRWPSELATIEAAPGELWVRGEIERLEERPLVAIVGSRSPTPYGLDQAERFAARLAGRGIGIVSGLARGIDQAAHRATLEAGGTTLAVLGSGVDCPWPDGELTDRIGREGVLISEFRPGTPPRRHHFPRRNRVISALADGVLVVEAAYASGSLITAHWAVDQGKAVFALPGRIDHPMARGCHRLLREGAQLIESPEELMAELGHCRLREVEVPLPDTPLLGALVGETLTAGELAARLEREVSEVLAELVQLELAGGVVRSPGGLYRLSPDRSPSRSHAGPESD